MNKYQEALIYFCNGCHHEYEEGNYGQCKRVEGRCGHYKSLKEACDKADKYDEINRVYLKNEVMESADINAERLQQLYEDMQTFIDKATPKRPKRKRLYYNCHNGECDKTFIHYCPICNFSSVEKNYANYCPNCGQKLDWSDEDDK